MFEFNNRFVLEAERIAASGGDLSQTLNALRKLGLDDFGLLTISLPNSDYPAISRVLPSMASEQVQRDWTGAAGVALLRQSVTFVRMVRTQFEALTEKRLSDSSILDFGCGYGRLLRLMMYFVDSDRLNGCDPWDRSIDLCRESRIACRLEISDYLPEQLPFDAASFDFIYAFSVFTHTSIRATRSALRALRSVVKDDGVLALTIRPIEYWQHDQTVSDQQRNALARAHRETGFAFKPHNRSAIDGDITYGDTSITFDYLASVAEGWTIRGHDRSLDDPYQIVVYLSPKGRP